MLHLRLRCVAYTTCLFFFLGLLSRVGWSVCCHGVGLAGVFLFIAGKLDGDLGIDSALALCVGAVRDCGGALARLCRRAPMDANALAWTDE
jgi:hypothetical protein